MKYMKLQNVAVPKGWLISKRSSIWCILKNTPKNLELWSIFSKYLDYAIGNLANIRRHSISGTVPAHGSGEAHGTFMDS
jgi:hypothetical protein